MEVICLNEDVYQKLKMEAIMNGNIDLSLLSKDKKIKLAGTSDNQDMLNILFQSKDWMIRTYLAQNPNVKEQMLLRLANDEHSEVNYAANKQLKENYSLKDKDFNFIWKSFVNDYIEGSLSKDELREKISHITNNEMMLNEVSKLEENIRIGELDLSNDDIENMTLNKAIELNEDIDMKFRVVFERDLYIKLAKMEIAENIINNPSEDIDENKLMTMKMSELRFKHFPMKEFKRVETIDDLKIVIFKAESKLDSLMLKVDETKSLKSLTNKVSELCIEKFDNYKSLNIIDTHGFLREDILRETKENVVNILRGYSNGLDKDDIESLIDNEMNNVIHEVNKKYSNSNDDDYSASSRLDALMDEEFIPKDESKSSNNNKQR